MLEHRFCLISYDLHLLGSIHPSRFNRWAMSSLAKWRLGSSMEPTLLRRNLSWRPWHGRKVLYKSTRVCGIIYCRNLLGFGSFCLFILSNPKGFEQESGVWPESLPFTESMSIHRDFTRVDVQIQPQEPGKPVVLQFWIGDEWISNFKALKRSLRAVAGREGVVDRCRLPQRRSTCTVVTTPMFFWHETGSPEPPNRLRCTWR